MTRNNLINLNARRPGINTFNDKRPPQIMGENEWSAALKVLSAPALSGKNIMQYIDFEERRVDFQQLVKNSLNWSFRERLLVLVAWDLFNGDTSVSLKDLATTLDALNLSYVIEGLFCFQR